MTSASARRIVLDWLEDAGFAVYELRVRHGLPAIGQIVMMDPGSGAHQVVRVLVGKRPPRCKRLLHDRQREGVCDVLAIVDPRDGSVMLREPASRREAIEAR